MFWSGEGGHRKSPTTLSVWQKTKLMISEFRVGLLLVPVHNSGNTALWERVKRRIAMRNIIGRIHMAKGTGTTDGQTGLVEASMSSVGVPSWAPPAPLPALEDDRATHGPPTRCRNLRASSHSPTTQQTATLRFWIRLHRILMPTVTSGSGARAVVARQG